MTSQEIENYFLVYGPYFAAIFIGWLLSMVIRNLTRKTPPPPVVCPLPSELILGELEKMLTKSFRDSSFEVFMKDAEKYYEAKVNLAEKK